MRMKRTTLAAALLLGPALALALDFTKSSDQYKDAPFLPGDAAGISVLTNVGAVSGYPDGTFGPDRAVNRAEFLKIAFLSNPTLSVTANDADDCFPDVKKGDWFSRYVCLAKRRGNVGGYPDGRFRPENPVNYAEAIKMLSELYEDNWACEEFVEPDGCTDPRKNLGGKQWYQPYVDWANERKLLLPISITFDQPLTRGQVARLAAAHRAEHDGVLAEYRNFEKGKAPVVSSSSKRSSTSSTGSVATSVSSSASSVSSSSASHSSVSGQTAESRFLLPGQVTPVLLDGVFVSSDEDALLRSVDLELDRDVSAIQDLILVNGSGKEIATLHRSGTSDALEKKWEIDVSEASAERMIKGVPVRLGIKARMKTVAEGGGSNELFELDSWQIGLQGVSTNSFWQPAPTDEHKVLHQTALGKIVSMRNALADSMSIKQGTTRLIGTFTISGQATTGAALQIKEFIMLVESAGVTLSNVRIGGSSAIQQQGCAIERTDALRISCPIIPEGVNTFTTSPLSLSFYADVSLSSAPQNGTLRLVAESRGKIGVFGTLRWSDGVGTFSWMESEVPMESGPIVTVTQ